MHTIEAIAQTEEIERTINPAEIRDSSIRLLLLDSLGRSFKLVRLSDEICARAALGLGCVAGQFHAIDGEHLASDQSLLVADE